MFVVFDLDGTLANIEHRVHHIQKPSATEKDWDNFYDNCPHDSPIHHALSVARALLKAGHEVAIWTGRSDRVRAQTMQWLWQPEHLGRFAGDVELVMRRQGDHTPDSKLKRKWVDDLGRPDLVFEDRDSVVAMWREEGIPCFQVAPGDF